jgi:GTP cyclohydrolase II
MSQKFIKNIKNNKKKYINLMIFKIKIKQRIIIYLKFFLPLLD